MSSQASLSFLPWVRQGLAASISNPDVIPPPKTVTAVPVTASVPVALKINDSALSAEATIHLRGPADVVGIDIHQVVRTEPRPGSSNFESNLFPSIEFDRPDFPWLFTPAKATADSKLRPWLCLVVVRKQAGVTLSSPVGAPLPKLEIANPANPAAELPDLQDCWAWAHAQAASLDNSPAEVRKALEGATELSLSRLICPRVLSADTDYIACVVPTFELGRKTGLGEPALTADLKSLGPAWLTTAKNVQLPVYYSWEFRTGPSGNFETLARSLQRAAPDGLGKRSVNIAEPGFAWTPDASTPPIAQVEGALRPLSADVPSAVWSDRNAQPFETTLAPIVNQVQAASASGDDPLLAPPLYGRWHRRRSAAKPGMATWFDELNLDPRWRTAAAIGTQVVQQHQEALMASAWEQAAELRNVNQRMRQLQMSMAIGESLHRRHVTAISKMPAVVDHNNEEMLLRFAAPVFSRIRMPVVQPHTPGAAPALGPTFTAQMTTSRLPPPATSPAMRRIGRRRGPITRRVAAAGFARSDSQTWVASINYKMSAALSSPPQVCTTLTALLTTAEITAAEWNYSFRIAPEGQPLVPLSGVDLLPSNWDYPGHFRSAAVAHLARIRPAPNASTPPADQPSMATGGEVIAQLNPRQAIAKLAKATVSTGAHALAPTANGVAPIGVETVMTSPSFPQPMYEPLRELSQDLLLPGLDAVKPNTVLGLETNRAFMEAYMVGLNTEMGRELLWRRYPTDQRGTYFRKFWGYDATQSGAGDAADIDEITSWGDRPLGSSAPGGSSEEFVLLLRSDLLRRYPNALIYLAPNVNGEPDNAEGAHVMPSFNGSLDPDIAFFGFPVSSQAAIGDGKTTGYFVIIQEHPTEPRFGLDPNLSLATTTYLSVAAKPSSIDTRKHEWGSNSAAMAAITLRAPVRIALRVSRLVAPGVIR